VDFLYFHATADGSGNLTRIGDKVVRNLLLMNKSVSVSVREFHPRKAIMPGGTVSDQGVPSFRTPTFRNAVPLNHEVRYAARAEMLAHSHSRLASTDNKRIYCFN
jgi:hypothetical protein